MGSSAGGHLASTVATPCHRTVPSRLPDPVLSGDNHGCVLHPRRQPPESVNGKNPSDDLVEEFSNEKQVKPDTPRAFIVFSDDDPTVPTMNGINYYAALKRNNVPASLHIYPSGGHGWGFRPNFRYHAEMRADLSAWLDSF